MVGLSGREEQIVTMLQDGGELSVQTLSEKLGVSSVTIRSDLRALESKGIILRTRGAAMSAYHPLLMEKQSSHREEKESIARAAAALVQDGDKIMITNGTTSALIGRYLLGKRDLQIVTNSTLLTPYARVNPNLALTIVGGEFRPSAEALVGAPALTQLLDFHVTYTFTGTDGFTKEHGLTTHLMENAEIVRRMCHQATKRVLVTDSSKYGKQGFVKIFALSEIDVLITDKGLPEEAIEEIRAMGIEVMVV
ncbi:MAG: DeoR/GlpR family DNA-binding transcription regulator [Sphaerochaetaceae bacterium]|jgi:DeoR family galactitol utilization operon repressor|nr:DeoR/GlpR family DNA-binding transcription regulator [Sphaerochaetaceae bacterium]MDD3366674.1 DeoR/GlpR family DNA-binding transcription regulator [Sphaerochaetaceae bacterium]MDD4219152.1 DeoR/GlpR family DNA-binding transcription regulator [Sphaerochaetaceae bacterium]MDY0370786.1 DeoR/GlpR family DNA-binding transcription regulator [Sphaerochaetaceae bacterium]